MPQAKSIHTLGADPEFFIVDETTYEVQSAVGLLEGTKEKPLRLNDALPPEFNYHRDNVLLEVGIPPARDAYQFIENINSAVMYANDHLARMSEPHQHLAIYRNADALELPAEMLDNPEAREFGCEPDQDAYEGGAERSAPDGLMGNWRTAGGHVHIGCEGGWNCPKFIVALLCDAYIGVMESAAPVGPPEAKYTHYRKPGLYRDKPYGIEYRTPSNQWVFNNNRSYRVGNRAMAISKFCNEVNAKKIRKMIEEIDWIWVRSVIETGDRDNAIFAAHKRTIKGLLAYGGE